MERTQEKIKAIRHKLERAEKRGFSSFTPYEILKIAKTNSLGL